MKLAKFLIFLILFSSFVNALDLPDYKDKYINDFANIFSQEQSSYIGNLLSQLEKNTTSEVSVVTIQECVITTSEYANKLFNKWGIGKKNKDNGLLILYCKEENKIWVETGYGLEGILPDSKLGRMLDDYYVPSRDSGNVTNGIILFTENTAKVIQENKLEVIEKNNLSNKGIIIIVITLFCFIILIILIILSNRKKCPKCNKKLKKIDSDREYTYYKCINNHKHKIKKQQKNWFLISSGGFGGGFGRGGFGGGGFGGGFGGGGSGGGGAGR